MAHRVAKPAFGGDGARLIGALDSTVLPYGMGRSYGDSCLNRGGALLDTRSLDRFINFDDTSGLFEVEAGVTLAAILLRLTAAATGSGTDWFLPVSPGTKFVTVGGAIANDVHGKNHHRSGCFGNHVVSLRLLRSDGAVHTCSRSENVALFAATVGGLGLTGLVLSAVLQMRRVRSLWLEVEDHRFDNLAAFGPLSEASVADWEYTVAWVDCSATGAALGRGIFTRARHVAHAGPPPLPVPAPRVRFPADLPGFVLNRGSVAAFNALDWRRAPRVAAARLSSYEPVLFPLDAIGEWNRMYGRRGFHQYQCVIPAGTAADAIPALLRAIAASGQGSFLAVLKTLGAGTSPGLLSFPLEGTTLALDFPHRGASTYALLDRLDAITDEAAGRIYPAKDGRVGARDFQRGYPNWRELVRQVDPQFSSSFWRRVNVERTPLAS